MKLYSRWQNSAGERVRIALHLKGIPFTYVPVSSLQPGEYGHINPQGLLPALEVEGGIIAQSAAILEYVEETFPSRPLLPADPITRAQARAFGAHVMAEMHALTVVRVRKLLGDDLGVDETGIERWLHHWAQTALRALETAMAERLNDWPFCFGEAPGWADLHLVPELARSRRFGCDLSPFPKLLAIDARCQQLDAFVRARPEAQPDFPRASR